MLRAANMRQSPLASPLASTAPRERNAPQSTQSFAKCAKQKFGFVLLCALCVPLRTLRLDCLSRDNRLNFMPRDYPLFSHARKCRAFSLIELLVVIGIIAILISILMPTLNKTREAAKTIKCQAQLRQMGQAIYAYANSNHGLTPAWSSTHNWPDDPFANTDPNGPGWPVLLMPYTGVNPISPLYTCP